jgi:hypothetical protein
MEESAMQDTPRVRFLVTTNEFVVALLVILLSGCVSTPSRFRERNGDFIMNIGSAKDQVSPALVAKANGTAESTSSRT